jgi:hypothetical protein
VQILFSQGPTSHSRLANSLLWMARAYPDLQRGPVAPFLFPWGRERFADFLDPHSPWLANPTEAAASLFLRVCGEPLTAQALADFSRRLESAEEARRGLAPYGWKSLCLRRQIHGVDLAYCTGADLPFLPTLLPVQGADLVIVHEPYQFRYSDPPYPEEGLAHLAPSPRLLEAAVRRQAALNPEGRQAWGLHIRRGDYAHWQNGRYFYPDSFWLALAERRIRQGSHVNLFTNDPQAELCGRLQALGAHLSAGSPGQDLVRMMQMDQLSGPPSTFPLMARALARFCQGRQLQYEILPAMAGPSI